MREAKKSKLESAQRQEGIKEPEEHSQSTIERKPFKGASHSMEKQFLKLEKITREWTEKESNSMPTDGKEKQGYGDFNSNSDQSFRGGGFTPAGKDEEYQPTAALNLTSTKDPDTIRLKEEALSNGFSNQGLLPKPKMIADYFNSKLLENVDDYEGLLSKGTSDEDSYQKLMKLGEERKAIRLGLKIIYGEVKEPILPEDFNELKDEEKKDYRLISEKEKAVLDKLFEESTLNDGKGPLTSETTATMSTEDLFSSWNSSRSFYPDNIKFNIQKNRNFTTGTFCEKSFDLMSKEMKEYGTQSFDVMFKNVFDKDRQNALNAIGMDRYDMIMVNGMSMRESFARKHKDMDFDENIDLAKCETMQTMMSGNGRVDFTTVRTNDDGTMEVGSLTGIKPEGRRELEPSFWVKLVNFIKERFGIDTRTPEEKVDDLFHPDMKKDWDEFNEGVKEELQQKVNDKVNGMTNDKGDEWKKGLNEKSGKEADAEFDEQSKELDDEMTDETFKGEDEKEEEEEMTLEADEEDREAVSFFELQEKTTTTTTMVEFEEGSLDFSKSSKGK